MLVKLQIQKIIGRCKGEDISVFPCSYIGKETVIRIMLATFPWTTCLLGFFDTVVAEILDAAPRFPLDMSLDSAGLIARYARIRSLHRHVALMGVAYVQLLRKRSRALMYNTRTVCRSAIMSEQGIYFTAIDVFCPEFGRWPTVIIHFVLLATTCTLSRKISTMSWI